MQEPALRGKTALITGGGRGIGRATALALARCGATIVITGRRMEILQDAADAITAEVSGSDVRPVAGDVSREDDVRRIVQQSGTIDILINNAGVINPISPLAAAEPSAWLENIAINLNGAFLPLRYVLPGMIERRWGRVVNVSSGAARGTTSGWSAYSAAKAGVEAMTSVVAREVGDHGVRVNAFRPGIVDTDMQGEIRGSSEEQFTRENLERFRGYKEKGTLRDPSDPARVILWLLSPEADHRNGEVLAIDDPEIAARVGLHPMGR